MDIEKYEWSDCNIIDARNVGEKQWVVLNHLGMGLKVNRNDAIALAKHFNEHKSQVDAQTLVHRLICKIDCKSIEFLDDDMITINFNELTEIIKEAVSIHFGIKKGEIK